MKLFGNTPLIEQKDGSQVLKVTLELKLTDRELGLTERGLKEYIEHNLIAQVNEKISNL